MTSRPPVQAVSPLDGRYARYTEPLVEYASEQALMRARVRVEVEYLIALANLDALLAAAAMARADLLSLRVLTTDMDAFLAAEGVLLDWLRAGAARPTRTLLGVARLTEPAQTLELEAEALA
mgnify:CR=1 FL=1